MAKWLKRSKTDSWMPIDSRLFQPFLSFGHVTGIARVFLQIEMVLSVAVVGGTLALLLIKLLQ